MIKNYSGKIAFAGAMVAIALLSRAVYPRLYPVATGNSGRATCIARCGRFRNLFFRRFLSRPFPARVPGIGRRERCRVRIVSLVASGSGNDTANAGAVAGGSPRDFPRRPMRAPFPSCRSGQSRIPCFPASVRSPPPIARRRGIARRRSHDRRAFYERERDGAVAARFGHETHDRDRRAR